MSGAGANDGYVPEPLSEELIADLETASTASSSASSAAVLLLSSSSSSSSPSQFSPVSLMPLLLLYHHLSHLIGLFTITLEIL